MEPITREEMFLSDIAGESNFDLEPITRTEKFLDKIAKSGGGGGVSSWNDLSGTIPVEKLPEGYPYAEEKVLTMVEEEARTSEYKSDYGAFVIKFEHGFGYVPQKITATYDGQTYSDLEVKDYSSYNSMLGYLAGNLSLMNSIMGTSFPNTGEPFIIGLDENLGEFLVTDTAPTEHICGIKTIGEIIHKMDSEYLPNCIVNLDAAFNELKGEDGTLSSSHTNSATVSIVSYDTFAQAWYENRPIIFILNYRTGDEIIKEKMYPMRIYRNKADSTFSVFMVHNECFISAKFINGTWKPPV